MLRWSPLTSPNQRRQYPRVGADLLIIISDASALEAIVELAIFNHCKLSLYTIGVGVSKVQKKQYMKGFSFIVVVVAECSPWG